MQLCGERYQLGGQSQLLIRQAAKYQAFIQLDRVWAIVTDGGIFYAHGIESVFARISEVYSLLERQENHAINISASSAAERTCSSYQTAANFESRRVIREPAIRLRRIAYIIPTMTTST